MDDQGQTGHPIPPRWSTIVHLLSEGSMYVCRSRSVTRWMIFFLGSPNNFELGQTAPRFGIYLLDWRHFWGFGSSSSPLSPQTRRTPPQYCGGYCWTTSVPSGRRQRAHPLFVYLPKTESSPSDFFLFIKKKVCIFFGVVMVAAASSSHTVRCKKGKKRESSPASRQAKRAERKRHIFQKNDGTIERESEKANEEEESEWGVLLAR